MAGTRGRCFYCSDSLAADVEHYVPIAGDYTLTFVWRNLLWVCPTCNRKKVSRFPTDAAGNPLLINPAEDEPWRFLILVSDTGMLAPRFDPASGGFDARGNATLDVIDVLIYEASNEGRIRVVRRLRRAAQEVLDTGGTLDAAGSLIREVREDDHGVASWFLLEEGQIEEPFAAIKIRFPKVWRRLVRTVVSQQHGKKSTLPELASPSDCAAPVLLAAEAVSQ